ncbi:P-loop containing nucleoside triphosphate hydrolase protein [Mycena sp. CBHHK59/15]|nr:P-loop containing nucleoside triphosphate hydrolase protein [Mycena sp. CBHHK59/15]
MHSSPIARSSVLGKRPHHPEPSTPAHTDTKLQLQTPDNTPNPKRPRTSGAVLDGESNKENVPPFNTDPVASPSSPRAARSLRRTTTSDGSPSRVRQTVTRRASTSAIAPATPTAAIAQLTLATPPPTPPNSLLPIHVRARALLRATCNSAATEMAGRDSERAAISAFFGSLVDEEDAVPHTSLYISGSPGTGKTALVNSIVRTLSPDIKVVTINCMALNTVDALWERLIEELGGAPEKKRKTAGRVKKVQGRDAVDALLAGLSAKCILILDELDHIAPTAQSLSSLFGLPASRPSILRVVGIANTHTLTASSATALIPSSSNVRTLHFAPYTPAQLLQILQSRLAPLYTSEAEDGEPAKSVEAAKKFLSPSALNLLTKKIAALTGDVRSLFEVLRGAIDLAVTSPPSTPSPSPVRAEENPLNPPVTSAVTPSHILAALKAYTPSSTPNPRASAASSSPAATNSEVVTKIRSLGLQARLVLLALLLASKRIHAGLPLSSASNSASPVKRIASSSALASACGAVDPAQLHSFYAVMLSRSCDGVFSPVSRSEFGDLVGMLEGVGLVVCPSPTTSPAASGALKGKRAFGRSASFGFGANRGGGGDVQLASAVRTEEVLRGLGIGMAETAADEDVAVEEVNTIWVKENGKLARDTTARDNKAKKDRVTAGFDEAMED